MGLGLVVMWFGGESKGQEVTRFRGQEIVGLESLMGCERVSVWACDESAWRCRKEEHPATRNRVLKTNDTHRGTTQIGEMMWLR